MIFELDHIGTEWTTRPIPVRDGHDWRLVVSCTVPGTCSVVVRWLGGERTLVDVEPVVGPTVIDLPQRIAGRSIELRCSSPKSGRWAMTLSWSPDYPSAPVEVPC